MRNLPRASGPNPLGRTFDDWLQGRIARGEIAEKTILNYESNGRSFVAFIGETTDVDDIDTNDIQAWIASLRRPDGERFKPNTIRTMTASIRSFFHWMTELQMIELNPWLWVQAVRVPKALPRRVAADDTLSLLKMAPWRERTMIILMLQCGLRRAEVAGLRVEDWDQDRETLLIRHAKGDKEREVPVTEEAREALTSWTADGRKSGPMWPSSHRVGHGITPKQVGARISEVAEMCGIDITPHQLRHTFASDAIQQGATVVSVSETLGHADLRTTSIYTSSSLKERREQIEGRRYLKR